jgi:flagellar FliL protein
MRASPAAPLTNTTSPRTEGDQRDTPGGGVSGWFQLQISQRRAEGLTEPLTLPGGSADCQRTCTVAKENDDAEETTPAKGGSKKFLVLGFVVLLAAAGAAWFFLFAGSGEAEAEALHPGATVTLDPIAVNLAGGGYLKVGIVLQLTEDVAEEPDGSKALDLVISQFSQAQPADVTGARDALKAALEQRIIEAYEGEVMGIYYSEYVTQ